jgi:elongation factor Ts
MITTEQIKELRDRTGVSLTQCKKALEDAGGDLDKALESLRAKGAEIAAKKSDRTLGAGTVSAYIHAGGAVGAMVALQCETDFVSKNPEFKGLADDIAMHVAAMMPADPAELVTQPFIKDGSVLVGDLIKTYVQKFGERIEVVEFARFSAAARP